MPQLPGLQDSVCTCVVKESQWWRNKQNINDSVTKTDLVTLSDLLVPCGVESWGRSLRLVLSSRLCSIIYWRAASSSSVSSSVLILSNSMRSRWWVLTLSENLESSGRCLDVPNLRLKHSWFKSCWGCSTSLLPSHHVSLLTCWVFYTFYFNLYILSLVSIITPLSHKGVNSKCKQKAGKKQAELELVDNCCTLFIFLNLTGGSTGHFSTLKTDSALAVGLFTWKCWLVVSVASAQLWGPCRF